MTVYGWCWFSLRIYLKKQPKKGTDSLLIYACRYKSVENKLAKKMESHVAKYKENMEKAKN